MFEAIENPPPRHWRNFVLHSLVACFIVPLAGLGNYWITPVAGVVIGICTTQLLRDRAALLAIVPSFLLFALASMDPISSWETLLVPYDTLAVFQKHNVWTELWRLGMPLYRLHSDLHWWDWVYVRRIPCSLEEYSRRVAEYSACGAA